MHFELIQSAEKFNAVAEEWNELLRDSASHVPFLRHEYLSAWWHTLGGGEWQKGELMVVLGRDLDGRLVGAAPLFLTQNRFQEPALMLIGSIEISDYLDFLGRAQHLETFLDGMMKLLSDTSLPLWCVFDLYNIQEDSPTLSVLHRLAQERGWTYDQETLQPCPRIPLPGDWEVYLAGVDKKQRHEIRRKMRRAEEAETPVRWYLVEDENTLDAEVDAFMHLMAQDPAKEQFLTEVMRSQMHGMVKAAYHAGWLQLAFIEVGGEKAAAYMNFDYQDTIWVYNSGYDPRFRELSVGWVLLGYLIRWANENGRRDFDFMRGNEEYKYRFGAVDRRIARVLIRRKVE